MKIKIVIEDKKKGKVEIPLSKNELLDLYDVFWIITENKEIIENIKLNKCEESVFKFHRKLEHVIFDVISDGTWYYFKNKRLVKCKEKSYLVKKPIWRNLGR